LAAAPTTAGNPASQMTDRGQPLYFASPTSERTSGAFENCLIVGTTADAGTDSLRQVVILANTQPAPDTIIFDASALHRRKRSR